jgi:hypothetical protein
MRKGSLIIIMSLSVISSFLIGSCSNSEALNVELEFVLSSNHLEGKGKSLKGLYKYIPTNMDNIFYVNRTFQTDNFDVEHNYYLSIKRDTTFIGKTINDTIYFQPYLVSGLRKKQIIDFNFKKGNEVFLDAYGEIRWLEKDSSNRNFYFGQDFGNVFSDSVRLEVLDNYVISSITVKKQRLVTVNKYNTKEGIVFVKNVKYILSPAKSSCLPIYPRFGGQAGLTS